MVNEAFLAQRDMGTFARALPSKIVHRSPFRTMPRAGQSNGFSSHAEDEHQEASFERWLDSHMGGDKEMSTLWAALREIVASELEKGQQINATSVYALVLKTLGTLLDEHEKVRTEVSAQQKANRMAKANKKDKSNEMEVYEVRDAMNDHSDQMNNASLTRLAAAARLLHYTCIKLPATTAWNTLSFAAPILLKLTRDAMPHTVIVPALTALSVLLCYVPPALGASTPHLSDLFTRSIRLTITGNPKTRKRALRTTHLVLSHFSHAGPQSPSYEALIKISTDTINSGFQKVSPTNTTIAFYTLELLKHVIFDVPIASQKAWCSSCLSLPSLYVPTLTQCVFSVFKELFHTFNAPKAKRVTHDDHDDEDNEEQHQSAPVEAIEANSNHKLNKHQQQLAVLLVNSLFDTQPGSLDVGPTEVFCATVAEGFLTFSHFEEPIPVISNQLPKLFNSLLPLLKQGNEKSSQAATECLRRVLVRGLPDAFLDHDLQAIERQPSADSVKNSKIALVGSLLMDGLQVTSSNIWPEIMNITAAYFERLGASTLTLGRSLNITDARQRQSANSVIAESILKLLADLRAADLALKKHIDPILKQALLALGLQNFLTHIPIAFPNPATADYEGHNLWLLSFFREYLAHGEMSFFYHEMIPSATLLNALAEQMTKNDRALGAKHLTTLHDQIWAIFPRFCHQPRDLAESFSLLAETIGLSIQDKASIRNDLLHGLTNLITHLLEAITSSEASIVAFKESHKGVDEGEAPEEDIEVLQQLSDRNMQLVNDLDAIKPFCPNFLPILFNVYVSDVTPDTQNSLLHCIDAFLKISEEGLINDFYSTVLSTLLSTSVDPATTNSESIEENLHMLQRLTNLSICFVPFLSEANLDILFKTIHPSLSKRRGLQLDYGLQKKSWKVLSKIIEHHPEYAKTKTADIQALVANAELVGASKAYVIKNIARLLEPEQLKAWLQGQDKSFASKVQNKHAVMTPLPSLVLAYRDQSYNTRAAAGDALVVLAQSLGPETVIALLVVGLSSSDDHFKASTVACWTHIVQKFSRQLGSLNNGEHMHTMLKTAIILLDWTGGFVRSATLDFLKAMVRPTPNSVWLLVLPTILDKLLHWPDAVKTKFMPLLRYLLLKFIKKLDYEVVVQAMPKTQIKFLQNINQRYLHEKKKKSGNAGARQAKKDDDDDDEDSDAEIDLEGAEEDEPKNRNKNRMQVDKKASKEDKKNAKKDAKKDAKAKGSQTWIREDGDEVLDLTESDAHRAITTVDPEKAARKARAMGKNPFTTTDDGKLVITDYKSSQGASKAGILDDDDLVSPSKKRKRSSSTILPSGSSSSAMDISGNAASSSSRADDNDSDEDEGATKKRFFGDQGWNATLAAQRRKPKLDPIANTKSQVKAFKAKNAGGDVAKPGKTDPHAYIKPNPAFLNKRHRAQSVKQYEGLVGSKHKKK